MSQSVALTQTLDILGTCYGFSSVSVSDTLAEASPAGVCLTEITRVLESLTRIIALGSGLSSPQARLLCGVHGGLHLRLLDPTEFPEGIGAKFAPATSTMSVSGRSFNGSTPGAHLGHEWAHGLDSCLGRLLAPTDAARLHTPPVGVARFKGMGSVIRAALSAAPYQSILGVLATNQAEQSRASDFYASLAVAQGQRSPLPAFDRLAKSMLPGLAKSLRGSQRTLRQTEASMQAQQLLAFASSAALDCLVSHPDFIAMNLSTEQHEQCARFCAQAVESRSGREGIGRRGREAAIDLAKADIAQMLCGALRLSAPAAELLASAIIHIVPLKARFDDFHAAPYTGRSYWLSPGSLADLSCALVRVSRNQRALANSRLVKEKFVPMAFWWSMRRQVSEISADLSTRANSLLTRMSDSGMLNSDLIEHSKQWEGERGEYKAGALMFSDLVATGSKMIRQEAGLMGRPIDEKQARAMRLKISAPINDVAKRQTIVETVAESFEQFVLHQAHLPTPLGRACRYALDLSLIDPNPLEASASLDPSRSWMHNKDGDPRGNSRRWRALLRELATLTPLSTTPHTPEPSVMLPVESTPRRLAPS